MIKIKPLNEQEQNSLQNAQIEGEYIAVECPVMGLQPLPQMAEIKDEHGIKKKLIMCASSFPVPIDLHKIQSGLVVPGQEERELKNAIPLPPTIRVVLRKDKVNPDFMGEALLASMGLITNPTES